MGILTLNVVVEFSLVHLHSNPGAFLQAHIYLAVFMNTYIYPRASAVLSGSVDHDPLTVSRPFSCSHVMWRVKWVHKAGEAESLVLGEKSFAQVLGSLEVLQVFDEELRGGQVSHHFHLAVFVTGQNHDFGEAK